MQSYSSFRQHVLSNETTCVQEVERILALIEEKNNLNAYLCLDAQSALNAAVESDARFREGNPRPAEGMIVALKDNISTKGLRTTCGSKILENFTPVYDATVVERLRAAGAIIIGKTNCDEFAMGSSNENSAYGPVLHPLNAEYVPGGSSGGSAVAVAAGLAHASLGSDTGGSIRQPAAFCGVVGYKPSYGRISRYGLVAFASSLDQIGPFTTTVEDCALLLDILSGMDSRDATTAQVGGTQAQYALHHHDEALTIGILSESMIEGCSEEIIATYRRCIDVLRNNGAKIITVEIPGKEAWIPTYYILATAEASSNLARFDGVRFGFRAEPTETEDMMTATRSRGFGTEVKRRIMLGTYVLSSGYYDAYYKKGQQARRLVYDGYTNIFSQCDALFLPTTPTTPFKRGEKANNPVEMYLSDLFTVSANLAGIPAISIPAATSATGFSIGMQLQAASFEDEKLLRLAKRAMELFGA